MLGERWRLLMYVIENCESNVSAKNRISLRISFTIDDSFENITLAFVDTQQKMEFVRVIRGLNDIEEKRMTP